MLIGSGVKQQYSSLEPPNFDSSSISSEAESLDDVWSITDEQREYYINQFRTMQPDLAAVITGGFKENKTNMHCISINMFLSSVCFELIYKFICECFSFP